VRFPPTHSHTTDAKSKANAYNATRVSLQYEASNRQPQENEIITHNRNVDLLPKASAKPVMDRTSGLSATSAGHSGSTASAPAPLEAVSTNQRAKCPCAAIERRLSAFVGRRSRLVTGFVERAGLMFFQRLNWADDARLQADFLDFACGRYDLLLWLALILLPDGPADITPFRRSGGCLPANLSERV